MPNLLKLPPLSASSVLNLPGLFLDPPLDRICNKLCLHDQRLLNDRFNKLRPDALRPLPTPDHPLPLVTCILRYLL